MRTVVGRIHDEGVFGKVEFIQQIEQSADVPIVVDHGVVIGGLAFACLTDALGFRMRAEMHVGGVDPAEEGLVAFGLSPDVVFGPGHDLVVDRLHALARQRRVRKSCQRRTCTCGQEGLHFGARGALRPAIATRA